MGVLPFPLRGDRTGCPADLGAAADARERPDAVEAFDDDWRAHQEREERRLAYVAVTRPGTCCCAPVSGGARGCTSRAAVVLFLDEIAEVLPGRRRRVASGRRRSTDETNPTLAEEVARSGRGPARRRGAAVDGGAALVGRRAAGGRRRPARRVAGRARWAREAEPAAGRAGPADRADRDRRRRAAGAPVGVPARGAAPRPAAAGPAPAPPAARGARPVRPPGYRVPPLAGAAVRRRARCSTSTTCPAPATRAPRPTTSSSRAAGGFLASEWADRVPRRVEVPFATVVAGVVVRGRMDAVFAVPGQPRPLRRVDWKTGQQRRPAPTPRPPRSSSPRTGWPGPSWPAYRSTRVGAGSTTSATGHRPAGRAARRGPAHRAGRRIAAGSGADCRYPAAGSWLGITRRGRGRRRLSCDTRREMTEDQSPWARRDSDPDRCRFVVPPACAAPFFGLDPRPRRSRLASGRVAPRVARGGVRRPGPRAGSRVRG